MSTPLPESQPQKSETQIELVGDTEAFVLRVAEKYGISPEEVVTGCIAIGKNVLEGLECGFYYASFRTTRRLDDVRVHYFVDAAVEDSSLRPFAVEELKIRGQQN